jgi:hypothetical protein
MNNARNLLLMSVTAGALIVGADAVFAQAPSSAPPAQQNAPAEKSSPALEPSKGAPDAGKQSGQTDDKKGGKAAQDNSKDGMKPNVTASETKAPPAPGKTSTDMKADGKAKADMKADGKAKADMKTDATTKPDMKSDSKSTAKPGDAKTATETKTETKPAATTGQGAAGPAASLSTEQRTQIRTSIKGQQRATNVNFSISVGTQVPRAGVRFYPVSRHLVQINPSWRGYDYFLVGDQIIVVNPRTLEIVAVLAA